MSKKSKLYKISIFDGKNMETIFSYGGKFGIELGTLVVKKWFKFIDEEGFYNKQYIRNHPKIYTYGGPRISLEDVHGILNDAKMLEYIHELRFLRECNSDIFSSNFKIEETEMDEIRFENEAKEEFAIKKIEWKNRLNLAIDRYVDKLNTQVTEQIPVQKIDKFWNKIKDIFNILNYVTRNRG